MVTFIGFIVVFLFIVASFGVIFFLIAQADSLFGIAFRVLAAGFAFILFFAARAVGISIPELLISSFDGSGGLLTGVLMLLLPGIAGALSAYILFKFVGKIEEENEQAIYFIILLTSLVAFICTDVFIEAMFSSDKSAHLLPNAVFVIGVLGTLLFGVDMLGSVEKIFNKGETSKPTAEDELGKTEAENWRSKL